MEVYTFKTTAQVILTIEQVGALYIVKVSGEIFGNPSKSVVGAHCVLLTALMRGMGLAK